MRKENEILRGREREGIKSIKARQQQQQQTPTSNPKTKSNTKEMMITRSRQKAEINQTL